MKQHTALTWLLSNLPIRFKNAMMNECSDEIKQALQMEQEQIEDAFMAGKWDWSEHIKEGAESLDPIEYFKKNYDEMESI